MRKQKRIPNLIKRPEPQPESMGEVALAYLLTALGAFATALVGLLVLVAFTATVLWLVW
jgi:hypothetical protein